MKIIIWTFFAILIEQAICFPGIDFESLTNDEGLPEEFLNDLKNLVSESGLAKDDESIQEMLNGLLNLDLSEAPQNDPTEKSKTSTPTVSPSSAELPGSGVHQSLSNILSQSSIPLGIPELANGNQSLPNIPSPASVQPESSHSEIKSLAEWTEIDKMNAQNRRSRRRPQKTPSLVEEIAQGFPSSSADVLNSTTDVAQPLHQNQPIQSELGINPDHLQSPISVPEEVHANGTSNEDLSKDAEFIEWLTSIPDPKLTPMEESRHPIGQSTSTGDHGYISSAGWIQPSTDPKKAQHQVEGESDDEDDQSSSSWLSQLKDWGSFINPFA